MEKKNPSGDQFFRVVILSLGMMLLFQHFFGAGNQAPKTPPRKAPALAQAFKGLNPADPSAGPALSSQTAALTEIHTLEKNVEANDSDDLAMWSKLRIGLIQQYVLGDLPVKQRKSGFLGFGSNVSYYPIYDDIIRHAAGDAVEAQALYQVGDLDWRKSLKTDPQGSPAAAASLEALIHRGRGSSSQFLDSQIYVPTEAEPSKVPLTGLPPGGFKTVRVRDLKGTLANPNPQGILDRINAAYSQTVYYKAFDFVVKLFGANPAFSYGLAILAFAICTRTVFHPLYRKQYDSMKGLALIQPEMKKIQEKYKGSTDSNAQMAQYKEIQALQRRHGVNPLMGCFLGLLQMPIFFVLVSPLIQHYEPKMELVGATFLWIANLSRPDYPLLILYALSMFLSFRLSSTPPTDEMQKQQQQIMSFVFPFIFPFMLSSYPSAFIMYWMTYNVLSTVFQWRLIKAADPHKSLVKTLMGTGPAPISTDTDAVPERPKKGDKAPVTVELAKTGGNSEGGKNGKGNGMNGSLSEGTGVVQNGNGKNGNGQNGNNPHGNGQNGMPKKAAENGTVLKAVPNKKKK